MSFFTQSQIIYIDSKNRLTGSHGNFSIKIDIDQSVSFDRVTVLDCSLPKTYYSIPDGYNTFILDENGSQATITITPGNCTRMSLATVLATALNSASPNGFTYNCLYDNISREIDTGKLTFSVSNNSGIQPSFIFDEGMAEQMGFESATTYNFSADSLTSPNVINVNLESTIFIKSTICQDSYNNILQNIITPLNNSFSYIVFQNPCPLEYSKVFYGSKSNVYTFTITNESGRVIDFNGANVIITLKLYKRDRSNELLSQSIKIKNLESLTKNINK